MEKHIFPSSLNPQPSTFPPSVQSDLFNYLKPHQREAIRPYLRIVKPQYQEKLCVTLLDYLEGHGLNPLMQPVLNLLQEEIVHACNLKPLTSSRFKVQGSKTLGDLVRQLFPSLNPQPSSLNQNSLIPQP